MGVIKSASVPASASPFSMADIETAARRILMRAQQDADRLLAATQVEAAKLKADAKTEGMAQGQREGLALGTEQGRKAGAEQALAETKAQFQQVISALTKACSDLDAGRVELESSALHEVVKLAIAIAGRITKRQGLLDPQMLIANLESAAKLVVQQSDLRIGIHPSQRKTLEEALPLLAMQWPALRHVEIAEDPALSPGGCRLFTRQGLVDADLNVQLDRIVNDLLPVPAEGGP
jgi:flagellar assembly protein FliH